MLNICHHGLSIAKPIVEHTNVSNLFLNTILKIIREIPSIIDQ